MGEPVSNVANEYPTTPDSETQDEQSGSVRHLDERRVESIYYHEQQPPWDEPRPEPEQVWFDVHHSTPIPRKTSSTCPYR